MGGSGGWRVAGRGCVGSIGFGVGLSSVRHQATRDLTTAATMAFQDDLNPEQQKEVKTTWQEFATTFWQSSAEDDEKQKLKVPKLKRAKSNHTHQLAPTRIRTKSMIHINIIKNNNKWKQVHKTVSGKK